MYIQIITVIVILLQSLVFNNAFKRRKHPPRYWEVKHEKPVCDYENNVHHNCLHQLFDFKDVPLFIDTVKFPIATRK